MTAKSYKQASVFFALSLILVSVTTAQQIQPNQTTSARIRGFKQPNRYGDFEQEYTFKFSIFGQRYTIKSNGQASTVAANSKATRFRLKLDRGFYIESLSFLEYEGKMILLCGISDADAGGGIVYSLNRGNLRTEWMADIPGFNVGKAIVEENHAYITAIGFISKLDLRSGRYVWKHGDLYESNDAFNDFDEPRIDGDKVLFRGAGIFGKSPRTIEVDKRSGKILAMKD